jgi:type I restriction enzyme S subunit
MIKTTLGKVAAFKSGGTPRKTNPNFWGGNRPWVSAKDLKQPIIHESLDSLTDAGFAVANIAEKNSLLILVRGMTLHKKVPVCLAGNDVAFNQDLKALIPSSEVAPKFLLYYLLSKENELLGLVDSSGHGTGRLNTDLLKKFSVLLPPLPEQQAIAEVLSVWDRAIEKTERLIQAKQKRFAWLMNSLINSNEKSGWRKVKMGDVFEAISRKNSVGETNVLTSSAQHGLVSQLDYYNKSVSAENVTGYYLLKRGEFAYNRSSSNGYPLGAIKRLDAHEQGVLSTLYLCFQLKPDTRFNSDFFLNIFESGILNRQLREICQEGARSHGLLNITKSDFYGLLVPLPPLPEQKRIAETLNLAQREIDLLKKLAEKQKLQKRGLMQKLLTGTWRVNFSDRITG